MPSIEELKKYKTTWKVCFFNQHFTVPLSPYILKILFLIYPSLTANHLSIFNVVFIVLPTSLIAFGDYWAVIVGAILLHVHLMLDSLDGTVARFKKTIDIRYFGEYYEEIFHYIFPPFLFSALAINASRHFENSIYLIAGLVIVLSIIVIDVSKFAKDTIVLRYLYKSGKKVVRMPSLGLFYAVPEDKLKKVKKISSIRSERTFLYNLACKTVNYFSSMSRISALMFILAVFDAIHYAIFFYTPMYVLIAIIKFYLETKQGVSRYEFR